LAGGARRSRTGAQRRQQPRSRVRSRTQARIAAQRVHIHLLSTRAGVVARDAEVAIAVRGHVVVAIRRAARHALDTETEKLRGVLADINGCKERICDIVNSHKIPEGMDLLRVRSYVHTLRVFEAEHLCQLKEWTQMMRCIGDIVHSDVTAADTFEAVADILWMQTDCPVNVLFAALEALLHASLDRNSLSVQKFSRWLRATCTILLCRNTSPDRLKAVGYVEQAIAVMDDNNETQDEVSDLYPLDERHWLLATSYNTGIECLQFVLSLIYPPLLVTLNLELL